MKRSVVIILCVVASAGWHGSRLPQAAATPPTPAGALALMYARHLADVHLGECIGALPSTAGGRVSLPPQPQLERIAKEIQAGLERYFSQWVWSVVVWRTRYKDDTTLIAGVDYGLAIRDACNQDFIPEDCATNGGALSLFRSLGPHARLNGLLAFTPTEPTSNPSPSAAAFAARVTNGFFNCLDYLRRRMTGADLTWLSDCLLSRLNTTERRTSARSAVIFDRKYGGVGAAEGHVVELKTSFDVMATKYRKNCDVMIVVQCPLSW